MDLMELRRVLPAPAASVEARLVLEPSSSALALRLDCAGQAFLDPLPAGGPPAGGVVAAFFHPLSGDSAGPSPLFAVPAVRGFRLNGLPPLGLKAVLPGDLLSFGEEAWLLLRRYRPEPAAAPARLAGKPCPVCDEVLGAAPVCACPCGAYFHLENPAGGGASGKELNCFLTVSSCPRCKSETCLEERLLPEPSSLGF